MPCLPVNDRYGIQYYKDISISHPIFSIHTKDITHMIFGTDVKIIFVTVLIKIIFTDRLYAVFSLVPGTI